MSPIHFNLAVEKAMQKTKELQRGVKLEVDINIKTFADDQ